MRACGYLITVGLLVSGCSSLPDFGKWFEGDTDEQAKTLVAEAAKTAGENSEEPEKAVQQLAYEKTTSSLADRMSNVLTSDNSNTRISITGQDTENTSLRLMNLTMLGEMAGSGSTLSSPPILYKPERSTLNVGIGRRILSTDEKTMYGLNAFLDYAPNYSHQRASLGFELRSAAFRIERQSICSD